MNIPLGEVVHFDAITSNPTTGAVSDADSTPTFAVYEESTDTDIGVGGNMTKRTSLTGNYRGSFTASGGNGFEEGKWYNVIVSATVAAVAGKDVAMRFRVVVAEATAGLPKAAVQSTDSTALAAIADVLWDEFTGGHLTPGTFGDLLYSLAHGLAIRRTDIATLTSQTVFTLTDGSTDDNAYNGCLIAITSGPDQWAFSVIKAWAGATRGVTLVSDPGIFTMSVGNAVFIYSMRALHPTTPGRTLDVATGGEAGIDWANVSSPTTTLNLSGTTTKSDALIVSGSVDDAGPTTTGFNGNSGLSASNDFYNGAVLAFTSGALAGIARKVSDYVGATRTFSFSGAAGAADAAWPSAPANGDAFMLLGRIGT